MRDAMAFSTQCVDEKAMNQPVLICSLLSRHFGADALEDLVVLRFQFPYWMRPDVLRAIDRVLADGPEPRFVCARMRGSSLEFRFSDLIEEGKKGIVVGPPVYDEVNIGEQVPVRCPQRALWLQVRSEAPLAVLMDSDSGYRRTRIQIEVAASRGAEHIARATLERIREHAQRAESFRGKVLAPAQEEYMFDESPTTLRIARVEPVARDHIVLPPGLLELVERNTIGFANRCDTLVRLGMSGQKGVLLYGPPGTGKTFLVRYLSGALKGYTTFLLPGDKVGWLADTIEAARMLSPSLVVIEDVDLIAAHRDGPFQVAPAGLNRLLAEMDGAGPEARILFLLTTNRPEVLEPALAARPGRVDQAIEIGLPDDPERRKLLRCYLGSLACPDDVIAHASRRAGRVSPAYIRELARRAAQTMLERGGEPLSAADFAAAFADLGGAGSKVTARLLGAEGFGFAPQV